MLIQLTHQCYISTGLKVSDITMWEINEAFSAVILEIIEVNPELVNQHGGVVSLSDSIGGFRILTFLVHNLQPGEKAMVIGKLLKTLKVCICYTDEIHNLLVVSA